MDDITRELAFISAAYAAGCDPCLLSHVKKAMELDVEPREIKHSIEIAKQVRKLSDERRDEIVAHILGDFKDIP